MTQGRILLGAALVILVSVALLVWTSKRTHHPATPQEAVASDVQWFWWSARTSLTAEGRLQELDSYHMPVDSSPYHSFGTAAHYRVASSVIGKKVRDLVAGEPAVEASGPLIEQAYGTSTKVFRIGLNTPSDFHHDYLK
jgi:hypothetical protein